ncbi:MAG: hypothetical protein NVS1B4_25220 [Gemmatimonadaceae bacterium]
MWLTTARLLNSAAALVRERLRHRPPMPISDVGADASVGVTRASRDALIEGLASAIGVEARCLRLDDRLQDILRVHRDELPPDHQKLMTKIGLHDFIDPLAFDLLAFVERRIGNNQSRLARFKPWPKNEGQWIDRILRMTVADLVDALA